MHTCECFMWRQTAIMLQTRGLSAKGAEAVAAGRLPSGAADRMCLTRVLSAASNERPGNPLAPAVGKMVVQQVQSAGRAAIFGLYILDAAAASPLGMFYEYSMLRNVEQIKWLKRRIHASHLAQTDPWLLELLERLDWDGKNQYNLPPGNVIESFIWNRLRNMEYDYEIL